MLTRRLTFLGLESFWWGTLLLACFVVAVVVVVRIYRYERRLVPRPIGFSLLGLRAALLVLFFLMALQPTITWTNQLKEQMRVLVALDVSESMDLTDEHADDEERLRWAVGLGMVKPDVMNRSRINFSDPESEQDNEPVTADDSLPDSDTNDAIDWHQLVQNWDNLSRFELSRQLLTAPQTGLLARLQEISGTEVMLFSRKTRTVAENDLTGSRSKLAEDLVQEVTSYRELLQEAAARENCTAVILMTDGVENAENQPLEVAGSLAGQSRPVFSILAGSIEQPVDLAIASVDHPESVYKDDQPLVRVRATTYGFENEPLVISLTDTGTGNRQIKTITGTDRYVDVDFDLQLPTPGRQNFVVSIEPQATGREELRLENNQQQLSINVIDDTTHVLLVDGEGRWEFRFLEAAFTRDERVELSTVLFEQPYLGLLPHSFFDSAIPNQKSPGGPFEKVDLVIWGDADPREVDTATWEKLEKYVSERGGTLVVSAGKRHFPALSQNPIMQRMLPIQHYRVVESLNQNTSLAPRERGFHLQLTPQGKTHPLMKIDTDSQKNAELWQKLPGHEWGLAGEPKPGAMILATSTGATPAGAASRPLGMIVVQNYGLGRVLWLGIDSTWRWRSRTGDRDHYRFWGQMTRWAAEMRSSAGSDDVRFGIDDADIEVGEETLVRARWSSSFVQNLPEVNAFVEVYPADQRQLVPLMNFPLDALETEPLIHEAKVPPLPPGEYRLQLKSRDVPLGATPIEVNLFVAPRSNNENQKLSADRAMLDQLAAITKGEVFLPHQLDDLLLRLNPDTLQLEEKRDIPLWTHWFFLVLMMLVLGAEWLLRKWHGLP